VSNAVAMTLVLALAAGPARAADVEPPPSVPVEVRGSAPGITVRLVGTGVDIACGERCSPELPPGRYNLTATGTDGRPSSQTVRIRTPTRITVTPPNQTARTAAMVLAPVSAAAFGSSVLLFWWAGMKLIGARFAGCTDSGCTDELPRWLLPTAFVTLGVGVVVGATALSLWLPNAHPSVDLSPLEPWRPSASRIRLLPSGGPSWGGLALNGSF
jgi:hypothetical protein